MTKASKTTPRASFAIGDRVQVTTAATLGEAAIGQIVNATASGWFIVQLDDADRFTGCKEGKLSARAGSMVPAPAAPSAMASFAAATLDPKKVEKTNGDALKAAKVAKEAAKAKEAAPKAAKVTPECPECESGELEMETDEDGDHYTCNSCGHEWDDEGSIEEALEEAEEAASRMSEALKKARARYTKTHRPDGTPSADNGDAIAKELRELEPVEVAVLADRVMGEEAGYHATRYAGLNNGQIRMNSGNRIRGAYRKAVEAGDLAEQARISKLVGIYEEADEEEADEEQDGE